MADNGVLDAADPGFPPLLPASLAKVSKKPSGPKTAQQCLDSISCMFAFDWSLKDIAHLKHNPCKP